MFFRYTKDLGFPGYYRNATGRDNLSCLTFACKPCFATFAGVGGGGATITHLGISKRIVVELRGKDEQIAIAEYSRLVVLFLGIGQYFMIPLEIP